MTAVATNANLLIPNMNMQSNMMPNMQPNMMPNMQPKLNMQPNMPNMQPNLGLGHSQHAILLAQAQHQQQVMLMQRTQAGMRNRLL